MSHQCFRKGCLEEVPDKKLACTVDWWILSAEARAAVINTVGEPLTASARRDALARAQGEWNASRI